MEKLKELILINNQIKEIPKVFLDKNKSKLTDSLKILILNSNPISIIPDTIINLKKLQTLGLASTDIKELPDKINGSNLKRLKQILVHDTNLVTPSLAIALRGVEAIKEFFDKNAKDSN